MRFIAAVVLILCAIQPAHAEWRNALEPKGTKASTLTLVRDGRPLYGILLPTNPTGPEKKAADDLRQWVEEMTGAELPLAASQAGGRTIRIATDPAAPGGQYSIAVDGDGLRITGRPRRGVINAVYALLEEDVGFRWYTKDSFRLPKSPTLTISPVARTYAPKLKLRDPYYKVSFDADWSLRNRTNAPDAHVPEAHGGRGDYGGLFVHTHATLLPPDKYAKEHPEYFFLYAQGQRSAAQLCPTNPQKIRIVTDNVLLTLRKTPHTEIVSISKN